MFLAEIDGRSRITVLAVGSSFARSSCVCLGINSVVGSVLLVTGSGHDPIDRSTLRTPSLFGLWVGFANPITNSRSGALDDRYSDSIYCVLD